MFLSRLIAFGFLGGTFAVFQFIKYCRLLSDRSLAPEEAERYQARAQRWLAAAGGLAGMMVLSIIFGAITQ